MRRTANYRFLSGLTLALGVLGAGVHWTHGYQVQRNAGGLLAEADTAEREGKLAQAADCLNRYLAFRPNDTDALARYGFLLADEKLATSPRQRLRAFLVLDQVLRRDPDRANVRREVARLAMDLHRFSDAREHLERLQREAPHDGELVGLIGRCCAAGGKYGEARKLFETAMHDAPQIQENYEHLAHLLRQHTDEVIRENEKPSGLRQHADSIIDAMVQANPKSFKAYLARAQYRKSLGIAESDKPARAAIEQDINRARELAPGEPAVALASADLAQDQKSRERARADLDQVCRQHPDDWRIYQARARLESADGKPDAALEALQEGVKKLPRQADLLWDLTDILVNRGAREKATNLVQRLAKEGVPEPELDYMRARLLHKEGQWLRAARILEQAYPQLLEHARQVQNRFALTLVQQAGVLLGQCFEQLGDSDRANSAFSRVVARYSRSIAARLGVARSYANMGRTVEALDQYRQIMRLPNAPPAVWVEIARLMVIRARQSDRPDWQQVDQALIQAEALEPRPIEVVLLRAEALAAQEKYDAARACLLKNHEDVTKCPLTIWAALAALAERQGIADEVLPILAECEQHCGDSVLLRLARARYWARRLGKEARLALARLVKGTEHFSADDRHTLWRGLGNAYMQIGEVGESRRLWQQLANELPNDLGSRIVSFDLAVQAGDDEAMVGWIRDIQRIEGSDGVLWHYGEVCRLIWRAAKHGEPDGLAQARVHLATVAMRRSSWSRVPLCEAEIQDLLGNQDGALAQYLLAIRMGERGVTAMRRTVELLYERRRYAEAYQLFRKLPEETLLANDFQHIGAEVSLQAQDYLRALNLAQQAVAGGSKDYRDYIWYGQVCTAANQKAKADDAFRHARDLAPDVADVWVALVQHLAITGRKSDAEAEITKAERRLPSSTSALAMAQCHEAVSHVDQTKKAYESALAAKPDDAITLRAVASFYIRQAHYQDAEPLLRKLSASGGGKRNESADWARRTLAVVMAVSGNYRQSREALALVTARPRESTSIPSNEAAQDQRAQAGILALQTNRQDHRQAVRILENLVAQGTATPDDQFFLAQLYEAMGDWPKARQRLFALADPLAENAPYLAFFGACLLRHEDLDEAEHLVSKLETVEPRSLRAVALKARLVKARGQASQALALARSLVGAANTDTEALASLIEELGDPNTALDLYRQLVRESKRPEDALKLAFFFSRQKRVSDALDVCDGAWKSCHPPVVAQAELIILTAGPATPAYCDRANRAIETALHADPGSKPLSAALAALRVLQGRHAEAEILYREILNQSPDYVPVLNNLAWLLSFQADKARQGLELLKRAIDLAGPRPNLLDTRALIYLRLGRADLAMHDLENASAESTDPSVTLHLAQACFANHDRPDAEQALRKARTLGLKETDLHPLERPAYTQLVRDLDQR